MRIRFFVFCALVAGLLLAAPGVALAKSVTVKLKAPAAANDLHISYHAADGTTQTVSGVSGYTWNGSAWVAGDTSASTPTTASLAWTGSVPWVVVKANLPTTAKTGSIHYEWTIDGVVMEGWGGWARQDVNGAWHSVSADAYIQRSIKMTVTGPDELHFGRVRFGETPTLSTTLRIESNDVYDLYVSGESDPVSRGNMLEFMDVRCMRPDGIESSTGLGGLASTDPAGGVCTLGESLGWPDSFFDVFFQIFPEPATKPGYYKAYIDFMAVQNY